MGAVGVVLFAERRTHGGGRSLFLRIICLVPSILYDAVVVCRLPDSDSGCCAFSFFAAAQLNIGLFFRAFLVIISPFFWIRNKNPWLSFDSPAVVPRSALSTTSSSLTSRTRRDGRFIERIGFYNPIATEKEEGLRIAADRLNHWQQKGAQLSPTVARLVKQAGAKAAVAGLSQSLLSADAGRPRTTSSFLGKIVGAYGLGGAVKVFPLCRRPACLGETQALVGRRAKASPLRRGSGRD